MLSAHKITGDIVAELPVFGGKSVMLGGVSARENHMFGLFGKIKTQPGQREAMLQHLLKAACLLETAEGCLIYIVSSDPNDPDGIWVQEVWRSQADHQASLTLDAIKELIAVARPLIAEMSPSFQVTPLGGKGLPE